ncbi:MAG: hypothetical protein IPJ76_01940 [Flavobacteriales bacterium]|nr:MAG: hypothetical protein IPJ76_01940 [Flavobacteriales bacterium]
MSHAFSYKLAKMKGGLGHYGEITVVVEARLADEPTIVEAYSGTGWERQGYAHTIPDKGFDDWKSAIRMGIEYALRRLEEQSIRVTVKEATGLITDTNATILAYAASRALLENLPNLESQTEKDRFEQLVFSSFNYEDSAQLDLEQFQLIGQLRPKSPYRVQANG